MERMAYLFRLNIPEWFKLKKKLLRSQELCGFLKHAAEKSLGFAALHEGEQQMEHGNQDCELVISC